MGLAASWLIWSTLSARAASILDTRVELSSRFKRPIMTMVKTEMATSSWVILGKSSSNSTNIFLNTGTILIMMKVRIATAKITTVTG